jgi:CRP-like cAMP-binding protein
MTKLPDQFTYFLQMHCTVPINDWKPFEDIFEFKKLYKGEFFVKLGDEIDLIGILTRGLFRSFVIDEEGIEKTVSFAPEGRAFANEAFIFENKPSQLNYQALEDCELFQTRYSLIEKQLDQNLAFGQIFRNLLAVNFMEKTRREIEFVQFNATGRLVSLKNRLNIDLNRLPKAHLASYLGITPQSLSRIFKQLRKEEDKE